MATNRKHALVRTAQARELVMKHLSHSAGPLTRAQLYPVVADLELTTKDLANLLERMATHELIEKVEIEHPDYKYGFQAKPGAEPPAPPERKRRAKRSDATDLNIPIDIQPNRDGSVTIRVNGLALTVRKES